jgi:hypothetical protein
VLITPRSSPSYTSNDLLFTLEADSRTSRNYETIAQNAAEIQDTDNSPAVSMGPWLIGSDQTHLLTTISIYSQRGESREQIRLLYMNATALRIWRAMGQQPRVVGTRHRPPVTAQLAFGVPFSE